MKLSALCMAWSRVSRRKARSVPLAKSWQSITGVPWAASWMRTCTWPSCTVVPVPGGGAVMPVNPSQNTVFEVLATPELKARAPAEQEALHLLSQRWKGWPAGAGWLGCWRVAFMSVTC